MSPLLKKVGEYYRSLEPCYFALLLNFEESGEIFATIAENVLNNLGDKTANLDSAPSLLTLVSETTGVVVEKEPLKRSLAELLKLVEKVPSATKRRFNNPKTKTRQVDWGYGMYFEIKI